MSVSEFRSFKKVVTDYKQLNPHYSDQQIVIQLRLQCDADLKRAIDTNYTNWNDFTVEQAITTFCVLQAI